MKKGNTILGFVLAIALGITGASLNVTAQAQEQVWPQHYGGKDNNKVVNRPTATENAELVWSVPGEVANEWSDYAGHPVIANGKIYTARGQKLEMLDSKTGKVEKTVVLAQPVGFYSYITYGDDKIFVPLLNGQIQCFQASTLESVFLTAMPGDDWQALSAIYYQDEMIYTGFATASGNEGAFLAYHTQDIDLENGMEEILPVWSVDTGKGYYGSGAVAVNEGKHLVFAGDAGIVTVVECKTGKELSRVSLDGAVRTGIVSAEGYLWVATKSTLQEETNGNMIYKLVVNADGKIKKLKGNLLPDVTGSTLVVADEKVIIGGGSWEGGYLQVYDLNLNLLAEEKTEGEVKSPTATNAYDELYVYFVQNAMPGGIYAAKISKDSEMEISLLHKPEDEKQNYSMSDVIVGGDGMLYYANDSGYLFALKPDEQSSNYMSYAIAGLVCLLIGIVGVIFINKRKNVRKSCVLLILLFTTVFAIAGCGRKTYIHDEQKEPIRVKISIECKDAETEGYKGSTTLLEQKEITLENGQTVYDALTVSGIVFSGSGGYVRGIGGVNEYEWGGESGWVYYVNGERPGMSSSKYVCEDGDIIEWKYIVKLEDN